MDQLVQAATAPFAGLPLWAWGVIVLALVIALVAIASRRKRRQAVIKTRIG